MKGCRGEAHKCAKLTEEKVRAIRSSTCSNAALANQYLVSTVTIAKIKRRKLWKHLPAEPASVPLPGSMDFRDAA